MSSWVTRVTCILSANFDLATPFHSRLGVMRGTDGQTDGQTTVINALWPTLWGGHNSDTIGLGSGKYTIAS